MTFRKCILFWRDCLRKHLELSYYHKKRQNLQDWDICQRINWLSFHISLYSISVFQHIFNVSQVGILWLSECRYWVVLWESISVCIFQKFIETLPKDNFCLLMVCLLIKFLSHVHKAHSRRNLHGVLRMARYILINNVDHLAISLLSFKNLS